MTRGTRASDAAAKRLAWACAGAVLALYAVVVAFSVATGHVDWFTLATVVFPLVGLLILIRLPRNPIGWILLAIGATWAVGGVLTGYAVYGLRALPGSLPGPDVADALSQPFWVPAVGLMGIHLLLLFPDGGLPSPRWRPVAWVGAVSMAGATVLIPLLPGTVDPGVLPDERNVLGIEALKVLAPLAVAFVALIPVCVAASAVSLVRRYRRSRGTVRLQLKWLTSAAAAVALLYAVAMVVSATSSWDRPDTPAWIGAIQNAAAISFVLIPISIGVAILRYRLYDIDLVINKTLVYGAMAAFITAVYVAIVVGLGRALGRDQNLGLSILAITLVAVGFQPARARVERVANRLVYGTRATPYEVLSRFSGGMARTVVTEDALPRMASIVGEGLGASEVMVWLRVGSELVPEASWGLSSDGASSMAATVEGDAVDVDGADLFVPVRDHAELLGAIGARKPRGEAVTPAESKLLRDLASQAGLVLRNVRLVEELKTSRQRLVSAQDRERRRLERDLHDGAQQRLVSIALALRLVRAEVTPQDDPRLSERIDAATDELALALSELRELARGIHPAVLTERGLEPALRSLAERSAVPATVEVAIEGRAPADVEAAAYFVVSEALANVAKHARAANVLVRAAAADGMLEVSVTDDGSGGADASRGSGLRGLADRVSVVVGTLGVESEPGRGTRVWARIPIPTPGRPRDGMLVSAAAESGGGVR